MPDADSGYHSNSAVPDPFTPDDEDAFRDYDSVNSARHNVNVASNQRDEYANYDLTDHYTRKELARADKVSAIKQRGHVIHYRFDKSDAHPGANFDGWLRNGEIPFKKFRREKFLRVSSDLAGHAWCSFKTALNMVMAKYGEDADDLTDDDDEERPMKKRKIEASLSQSSQPRMREMRPPPGKNSGSSTKAFMKLLEARHAEEIKTAEDILAYSRADEWARRVLKLILGIEHLNRFGTCKEMDLFGIIGDFVVTGKPDGVTKVVYGDSTPMRDKSNDPGPSSSASGEGASMDAIKLERGQTIITLWKWKAFPNYRTSNSTEFQPAIMLMIYYRLLTNLFSPDFSFTPIWEKLEIHENDQLSSEFLQQVNKFIPLDDAQCLGDITAEFFRRRRQFPSLIFNPVMRIWYKPANDGRTHEDHDVTYKSHILDDYLDGVFHWWKGEKMAEGVDAENANKKCRSCKHTVYCHWRRSDGGQTFPPRPPDW